MIRNGNYEEIGKENECGKRNEGLVIGNWKGLRKKDARERKWKWEMIKVQNLSNITEEIKSRRNEKGRQLETISRSRKRN